MRSLFYAKSVSAMIASHSTRTRFWISSSNHPYEAAIKREAVSDFPFLAPTRGFEPPTLRLGGECSILLSYVGIWTFFNLGIVSQFQPLVNLESSSRSSVSVRSADTAFFRSA